jgi:hypothetical protein
MTAMRNDAEQTRMAIKQSFLVNFVVNYFDANYTVNFVVN